MLKTKYPITIFKQMQKSIYKILILVNLSREVKNFKSTLKTYKFAFGINFHINNDSN